MSWFSHSSKKSIISGLTLFIFLASLGLHTVEITTGALTNQGVQYATSSVVYDLVFVFLSFITYLWVDDIEAKDKKKKSIDDSLQWFWNKI